MRSPVLKFDESNSEKGLKPANARASGPSLAVWPARSLEVWPRKVIVSHGLYSSRRVGVPSVPSLERQMEQLRPVMFSFMTLHSSRVVTTHSPPPTVDARVPIAIPDPPKRGHHIRFR